MSHGIITIADAVNWDCSLNRGLVSCYLPLPDQQRGNVFRDICNRNHGALINSPTWSADAPIGGLGSIDCGDYPANRYVQAPVNNIWESTRCTVSVRFKSRVPNGFTGHISQVIESGTPAVYDRNFQCDDDAVSWRIFDGGSKTVTASFTAGTWVHAIGCATGSDIRMIVNGGSVTTTAAGNPYTGFSNPQLVIGQGDIFGGLVEHCMFWNRALSDNEMRLVYEDSIRGYPNTLNWYRPSRYAAQEAGGGGSSSFYSIFKPAVIRAA